MTNYGLTADARFVTTDNQKRNIFRLVRRRLVGRVIEGIFRLVSVILNSWFVCRTFYVSWPLFTHLGIGNIISLNSITKPAKCTASESETRDFFVSDTDCFEYPRLLFFQVFIELIALIVLWITCLLNMFSKDVLRTKMSLIHLGGFSTLIFSPSPTTFRLFTSWHYVGQEPSGKNNATWKLKLYKVFSICLLILWLIVSTLFFICKLSSLAFAMSNHLFEEPSVQAWLSYFAAVVQLSYLKDIMWLEGAHEHLYQLYPWKWEETCEDVLEIKDEFEESVCVFRQRILLALIIKYGQIRGFLLGMSIQVTDEAFIAHYSEIVQQKETTDKPMEEDVISVAGDSVGVCSEPEERHEHLFIARRSISYSDE